MVKFNPVTYNRNIEPSTEQYTQRLVDVLDEVPLFKQGSHSVVSAITNLMTSYIIANPILVRTSYQNQEYILGFTSTDKKSIISTEIIPNHEVWSELLQMYSFSSYGPYNNVLDNAGILFANAENFNPELVAEIPKIRISLSTVDNAYQIIPRFQLESAVLLAMVQIVCHMLFSIYDFKLVFKEACYSRYDIKYGEIATFSIHGISQEIQLTPVYKLVLPLVLSNPFIGLWHLGSKNDYYATKLALVTDVSMPHMDLIRSVIEQILFQSIFDFYPAHEFRTIKNINNLLRDSQDFI